MTQGVQALFMAFMIMIVCNIGEMVDATQSCQCCDPQFSQRLHGGPAAVLEPFMPFRLFSFKQISLLCKANAIDWDDCREKFPETLATAERNVRNHMQGLMAAFQSLPAKVIPDATKESVNHFFTSIQDRVSSLAKPHNAIRFRRDKLGCGEPDEKSPIGYSENKRLHNALATDLDKVNLQLADRVLAVIDKTDW